MSAGHTPGPWGFHEKGSAISVWGGGRALTYVTWMMRRGHELESLRNAALIAAAPTMLAALRRIIEEDAEGRGYLADIASKALKEAGLEP